MSRKAVFDEFTTGHLKDFTRDDYWDGQSAVNNFERT